jgi:hypothetical protein
MQRLALTIWRGMEMLTRKVRKLFHPQDASPDRKRKKFSRGFLVVALIASNLAFFSPQAAQAGITWREASGRDFYNMPRLDPRFDLDTIAAVIFDNHPDEMVFFLDFQSVPSATMFDDGKNSWAAVFIDTNNDGNSDLRLSIEDRMNTDLTGVPGFVYNLNTKSPVNCDLNVYNNINAQTTWIGFKVSRSCLQLPKLFAIQGYADYISNDNLSYDYVPDSKHLPLTPTFNQTSSTTPSTTGAPTYDLPVNIQNSSTLAVNYSDPPQNLSNLSDSILPSVVTIKCGTGSGTGWAVEVDLSAKAKSDGYSSYILTNHHVIENCLNTRKVTMELSNKTTVDGLITAWNSSSDVAGIVTKSPIKSLQWIGSQPRQGWWVGVIGSPLGKSGILTTGIISSINTLTNTFTMTAAINPGNSGGPVFDSTGRVLGLATSKSTISGGQLAEGLGSAQGVPLLCTTVITCSSERNPWSATPRFSEKDLIAASQARAKAEADAKAKADAEAAALDRAVSEKRSQCIDFNSELKVAIFNAQVAKGTYPASSSAFDNLLGLAPEELDCGYIEVSRFDSELSGQKKVLSAYVSSFNNAVSAAKLVAKKTTTISCVKGRTIKKVTGVNPKCPTGYKKK